MLCGTTGSSVIPHREQSWINNSRQVSDLSLFVPLVNCPCKAPPALGQLTGDRFFSKVLAQPSDLGISARGTEPSDAKGG